MSFFIRIDCSGFKNRILNYKNQTRQKFLKKFRLRKCKTRNKIYTEVNQDTLAHSVRRISLLSAVY